MSAQNQHLEDLLSALSRKAEQAEVFAVESESTSISFEAGELKSSLVEETRGIALRGLVNGRVGFTATSGSADPEPLVERAVASARFGEPVSLALPGALPGRSVSAWDASLAEVPLDRLVEVGREVIARLREADPSAKIDVDIERTNMRATLCNSAGAHVDQQASAFHVVMSVERLRGDDVLMAHDSASSTSLTEDYREAAERLAWRIATADRSAEADSGQMPVLFTPAGSMVLLLPLLMAVNGQNVQRGTSPLADRAGEQILDTRFTLWDDPTVPGRPASAAYDDEGVPCYRKALFRQGVLESFLLDLKTAALLGTASTGNGARGLFSLPTPSAANLVMDAGERPLEDMISDVERGLLVDSVLGLGQGNPLSGAFSNPVGLAYVIEHGEITGRVEGLSLAGNVYELLRTIGGTSVERQWVRGRYLLPHILLPKVDVVRSKA